MSSKRTPQDDVNGRDGVGKLPPLPKRWCWTTLEEIAEIEGGITKDQKRRQSSTSREVPYLRVANVQRGYLDLAEMKTIQADEDEIEALRLRKGDILFTEGGDRDKLGRGWVWNDEIDECIHQNHIFRARPWLAFVESKFISYHGNFFGQEWFTRTGKQTTNLASINKGILRCFPVPLAPIEEQRRIVAKIEELFSELDAGVAALERVRAGLKRYRAAVLKAAVEGKLTEDWRAQHPDTEPASVLLERILTERRRKWEEAQLANFALESRRPPLGWRDKFKSPCHEEGLLDLPASWTWASTLEICERVENGNTPPPNEMSQGEGEIPFIKVYNLTKRGQLDFSVNPTFIPRETHEGRLRRSRVFPHDVLINIVGPPLGKVSVVPNHFPEWNTNQAVVLFRAVNPILPEFLAFCLMCDDVMTWITRTAKATAGQFNVSVSNSRKLPIPLPPVAEQSVIVETLREKISVIDQVEAQVEANLKRATRLRQGILKQAFEGKLVPQDPSDEPAEQLLARIRHGRHSSTASESGKPATRRGGRRRKPGAALPLFGGDEERPER